jgi:putative endopeptidase
MGLSPQPLGQRVDDKEWGMTPQTVNAYYSPVKNEIVFPAAILQPPFFDPNADPAVNYGAIGGVIGTRSATASTTRAASPTARACCATGGRPRTPPSSRRRRPSSARNMRPYTFPTLPGMAINGRVAMGENIGDLGGILLGLEAYRTRSAASPRR